MRELTIGNLHITDGGPAFVVAEIGGNHQGSIETACTLMKAAAECGCDAVKFQKRDLATWEAQNPEQWHAPYNSEHAFGATYGEHRAALELDWDAYDFLKLRAENLGLIFFATAFDVPSVEFLARLGVPAIKLASASIVNLPLLEAASGVGVPVILSTGGATLAEIDAAVDVVYPRAPLALLHCVSAYPCRAADMQLRCVETLRTLYPNTVIGLSDHYDGIAMAVPAMMLGARIFEKHYTLSRSWKGSDQAFSLTSDGMRRMVRDLGRVREALGDGVKRRLASEVAPLVKMGRDREELLAGVSS